MPTPQPLSTIALPQSYELCRDIITSHGRTYSLATRLLTPRQQRAVWSLYAWARIVDDYVDCPADADRSPTHIEATVTRLSEHFHSAVVIGSLDDVHRDRDRAVISAAAQTFRDYDIDPQLSADFVHSMLMDVPDTSCHIAHFETWEQLDSYMWGSAAVIGLEMMPILGTRTGVSCEEATPYAECLGKAFQVTNFLRDIAEDFRRGRIYLPLNEWEAFGVGTEEIGYCASTGQTTPAVRQALAYFIARNRALYAEASSGVDMLGVPGRQAIRAAEILYSDILGEIERMNYNVFAQRAQVGRARKAKIALPLLFTAVAGRLRQELSRA